MEFNIKPLRNNVLIEKVIDDSDVTDGGIVKPSSMRNQKTNRGRVLAVGPGMLDKNGVMLPVMVKKNDVIIYKNYAGTEIDEDHIIISEDEILGIVDK